MLNQHGGSRTDTLVKLVLIFFLSLLSFSVGTFVGKQFSDSQHKHAALNADEEGQDRSTASVDPDATKEKPSSALSDEEIAKLENEFLQKDKTEDGGKAPVHKTAPGDSNVADRLGGKPIAVENGDEDFIQKKNSRPAKAAKAAPRGNATKLEKVDVRKSLAEAVAQGKKPMVKKAPVAKKENRYPSSLPHNLAGSTIGKFTVQISSHSSEEEAKAKAQELTAKGLKAFYVPAEVPGRGTWYRVNVGQFSSRQEALMEKARVATEAGIKDAIVQKIQK